MFQPERIYDGSNLPTYRSSSDGIVVVKRSPFTGAWHQAKMRITDEQLTEWNNGKMIQNAFPHLSADEREFLLTGITPEEWEKTFGKGE